MIFTYDKLYILAFLNYYVNNMDLKKIILLFTIVFNLLISASVIASNLYVAYYDVSGNQDVIVRLASLKSSMIPVNIKIYDEGGNRLYFKTISLEPLETKSFKISDLVGKGPYNWGLFIAEVSDEDFLFMSVEYYYKDELVSIDNIFRPIPVFTEGLTYVYTIYHRNTGDVLTGLVLMNPQKISVEAEIYVYDVEGNSVYEEIVELAPYDSYFISLSKKLEINASQIGLIGVKVNMPIILASEYYLEKRLLVNNVFEHSAYIERR